ncbi:MAG TPA: DUF456 family protein [Steroidobacteraceae bacterium]
MSTLTTRVRTTLASMALAGAIALPAHGEDAAATPAASKRGASRQETIGVATGLAVGALAAGPFGAIAGVVAGAWLGDRYHRQLREQAALTADLGSSENARTQLAQHTNALDAALTQEQQRDRQLEGTLSRADEIEADVSFRTNDDSIAVRSMAPLLKLGALAAAMPDATVHVEGFADPRGSDALNDALSARRAAAVAAVLASAGLPRNQLLVEAHGKSAATSRDGDLDGYAFDRRVTVRIETAPHAIARRE